MTRFTQRLLLLVAAVLMAGTALAAQSPAFRRSDRPLARPGSAPCEVDLRFRDRECERREHRVRWHHRHCRHGHPRGRHGW